MSQCSRGKKVGTGFPRPLTCKNRNSEYGVRPHFHVRGVRYEPREEVVRSFSASSAGPATASINGRFRSTNLIIVKVLGTVNHLRSQGFLRNTRCLISGQNSWKALLPIRPAKPNSVRRPSASLSTRAGLSITPLTGDCVSTVNSRDNRRERRCKISRPARLKLHTQGRWSHVSTSSTSD